jgi:hypothetical protein
MTRSAIVTAVCDLQAARKLAQLSPATSHHFCSVCQCYHLGSLNRVDHNNWQFRDVTLLRQHATNWRNAGSSTDQEKIFKDHGVRWSELWRLPYWDPTRQLAVDSMHCLFEGLIQRHVHEVLQLTDTKLPTAPAFSHDFTKYKLDGAPLLLKEKEVKQVTSIHALLLQSIQHQDTQASTHTALNDSQSDTVMTENTMSIDTTTDGGTGEGFETLRKKLMTKNLNALTFVCIKEIPGCTLEQCQNQRKDVLARALVEWVSSTVLTYAQGLTLSVAKDKAIDSP